MGNLSRATSRSRTGIHRWAPRLALPALVSAFLLSGALAYGEGGTDGLLRDLNRRRDQLQTFEVVLEHDNGGYAPGGKAPLRLRTRILRKEPDLCRFQVWGLYERSSDELVQDMSGRGTLVTDFCPPRVARVCDVRPATIQQPSLFPLEVGRLMRIGSIVSIAERDGCIEVIWENPQGRASEKWVSATFPTEPPFDPLTIRTGQFSDTVLMEAKFESYEDVGDGWRFPRHVAVRAKGANREVHLERNATSVKVNLDLPDSAFVVDLPLGTRVQGPGAVSYVVGDEQMYFDNTIRSISVEGDGGELATTTSPATVSSRPSSTESSGRQSESGGGPRFTRPAPDRVYLPWVGGGGGIRPPPPRSGFSVPWMLVGLTAFSGGCLLVLASVRQRRSKDKAGRE